MTILLKCSNIHKIYIFEFKIPKNRQEPVGFFTDKLLSYYFFLMIL